MSSSARASTTIRPRQAPSSVRLVNWPLRDGGLRAWVMLIALGMTAAGAGVMSQSGVMGGVCFVALALAAWRLWIPVTFELRSRGVMVRILNRTRQVPWTQIARYETRPHGLVLFAEDDVGPVAAMRSTYIRWNGQRDAIMEVVVFYTKAHVSSASTKTFLNEMTENPG